MHCLGWCHISWPLSSPPLFEKNMASNSESLNVVLASFRGRPLSGGLRKFLRRVDLMETIRKVEKFPWGAHRMEWSGVSNLSKVSSYERSKFGVELFHPYSIGRKSHGFHWGLRIRHTNGSKKHQMTLQIFGKEWVLQVGLADHRIPRLGWFPVSIIF